MSNEPFQLNREALASLVTRLEKLTQNIGDMNNDEVEELRTALQITREELETEMKGTTAMGNNYGNTLTEIVEKYGTLQALVIALQETVNTVSDNTKKLDSNIGLLKSAIETINTSGGSGTITVAPLEETENIQTATKTEFMLILQDLLGPYFNTPRCVFNYTVLNGSHILEMKLYLRDEFGDVAINSVYSSITINNLPVVPRVKMPTTLYSDLVRHWKSKTQLDSKMVFDPNAQDGFFHLTVDVPKKYGPIIYEGRWSWIDDQTLIDPSSNLSFMTLQSGVANLATMSDLEIYRNYYTVKGTQTWNLLNFLNTNLFTKAAYTQTFITSSIITVSYNIPASTFTYTVTDGKTHKLYAKLFISQSKLKTVTNGSTHMSTGDNIFASMPSELSEDIRVSGNKTITANNHRISASFAAVEFDQSVNLSLTTTSLCPADGSIYWCPPMVSNSNGAEAVATLCGTPMLEFSFTWNSNGSGYDYLSYLSTSQKTNTNPTKYTVYSNPTPNTPSSGGMINDVSSNKYQYELLNYSDNEESPFDFTTSSATFVLIRPKPKQTTSGTVYEGTFKIGLTLNLKTVTQNTGLVSLPTNCLVITPEKEPYEMLQHFLERREEWSAKFYVFVNGTSDYVPFVMKIDSDQNVVIGPVDNSYTFNDCIENTFTAYESYSYNDTDAVVEYEPQSEPEPVEEEEEEEEQGNEPDPSTEEQGNEPDPSTEGEGNEPDPSTEEQGNDPSQFIIGDDDGGDVGGGDFTF